MNLLNLSAVLKLTVTNYFHLSWQESGSPQCHVCLQLFIYYQIINNSLMRGNVTMSAADVTYKSCTLPILD